MNNLDGLIYYRVLCLYERVLSTHTYAYLHLYTFMYSEYSKLHCPINPFNPLDWQLKLKRDTSGQKLVKGYYSVPITAGFISCVYLFIIGLLFFKSQQFFHVRILGFTMLSVNFLLMSKTFKSH
jgi:hypothetical protein